MALQLPPQPPSEPPSYPALGLNILPDGAQLTILFGNGLSITQVIATQGMNDLCRQWLESRKALKQRQETELAVIRHVNSAKTKH